MSVILYITDTCYISFISIFQEILLGDYRFGHMLWHALFPDFYSFDNEGGNKWENCIENNSTKILKKNCCKYWLCEDA